MKFLEQLFHSCVYTPKEITEVKGFRHVYCYNPQGADLDYWVVVLQDREVNKQYKPTKKVLVSTCVCGNEVLSDTFDD